MKGLDWFRVMSDIGWDGDMEHRSDAAFRTFFELIGYSAYHLTDGVIPISDVRKKCNSRRLKCALAELEEQGQIEIGDENVRVVNYPKYQQTREEVEKARAKVTQRVARYRRVTPRGDNDDKKKRESEREKKIPPVVPQEGDEYAVFQYWTQVMGHPKAKWDNSRRTKIRARLDDGFSVDDLKQAIDGCKASPHHMGENETYTVYDGIDLIFRNASKTEWFMELAKTKIDAGLALILERNRHPRAVR